MQPGSRTKPYTRLNLNLPVGAMPHPLASDNSVDATADGLGWRADAHSDFAVGENDDANAQMWFPVIWPWYDKVLGNDGGNTLPHESAITLGEE